jgi:TetR/AcrR family transcriptional regulator, regulator of cefoperazone and chloramphenicol sensitivity
MSTLRPGNPPRRSAGPRHRARDESVRPDRGAAAREQLLAHATRIFSVKGYAGASTREICDAAGVNVASIHYYFGDKEGLYRAVLLAPITRITDRLRGFNDPSLSFEDSMRMLLAPFLATSKDAERDRAVMRLHLREMLEPSSVFREIVERSIVPHHNALADLVARHVGIARPDEGIHQLAFALVAIANDYCMSREFMMLLAPRVLEGPGAGEHILDRLVGYSVALLQHEVDRRGAQRKRSARETAKPGMQGNGSRRTATARRR